jgi:hypothetical protein
MLVQVIDSDTKKVLATLSEKSAVASFPLLESMYVPKPGTTDLIKFQEDPTAWLEGLPRALAVSSRLYALAIPEPEHPHITNAAFDKKAYMAEYHKLNYEAKKKAKEAAKEQGKGSFVGPKLPPPPPKPVAPPAPKPVAAPPTPPQDEPALEEEPGQDFGPGHDEEHAFQSVAPIVHPATPASTKHSNGLSANEFHHVRAYQSSSSGINENLRHGNGDHVAIPAIDGAIAKSAGLEKDTTVYRGVNQNVADKIVTAGVGGVFSDKAYGSTSFSINTANSFGSGKNIIHIDAKKGQKGIDMNKVLGMKSIHKGEYEFVLPRGTSYRITKIETAPNPHSYAPGNTVRTIHVEIVHHHA